MEPKFDQVVLAPGGTDPSPAEVRIALERILASPAFSRAERPGRFLRHLVESALDGQTAALKESALGCDVFGRPPDWDPRLEPIVRQEAARLRKRIARYYQSYDGADPIRISLPVGAYVPRFEKQPPLLLDSDDHSGPHFARQQPPLALRRLHLPYLVSLVILVALVTFAGKLWHSSRYADSISLAVLPFENVTADPADQYFSDGVTDELADLMSRYANVRTVPRSSTARFRIGNTSLPSVAHQLRADYLVKGSAERSADQLTIVASLIRGSDGASLWTNTYRRQPADLNAIEGDLSSHLAITLRLPSPATSQKHLPPAAAHDLYLRGRFESRQTTSAANARAQTYFREALKLDPSYDLAYVGLAQSIWNENIWAGTSPLLSERRKSEELWEKALQLDPQSAYAHSGLAMYAMQYDWDWLRAERELKAAISAADNSGAENNLATLYLIRGRFAEANSHMDRAKFLDPDSLGRLANAITQFSLEGRFDEARINCEQWMARSPVAPGPKLALAQILAQQGKAQAALKILSALPKDTGGLEIGLAQVKALSGEREEARRILASLEAKYGEGRLFAYDFAVAYAELKDAPNATRWMRRSMDAREGPALYIRVDPQLASVQNYPEFRALKRQMDLDW